MEDREFQLEQDKFKFDQHKQLDDKLLQASSIFDKQLFAFNIGLITLLFLLINKLYDFNVCKYWYIFFLFIALISIISSILLMGTYIRTRKILAIQKEFIFYFDQAKSKKCDDLDSKNARDSSISYWLCVVSWVLVIFVICIGIFIIDFSKEKKVCKAEVIDSTMKLNDMNTNKSGFDGKSFAQQLQQKNITGQSFAQQQPITNTTPTQQTQPAVSNSQPQPNNNNQNNNQ